jgi:hypothetical protein
MWLDLPPPFANGLFLAVIYNDAVDYASSPAPIRVEFGPYRTFNSVAFADAVSV